jgi:transcriptional regulator with XRE-family HTH domain
LILTRKTSSARGSSFAAKVQSQAKKEANTLLKQQLDGKQQNLKLIANSTSYGIFAEVNVAQADRLQDVLCFGPTPEAIAEQTKNIEKPGSYFHPLLAALIAGAARLMLAIAERLVLDEGLDWALCDTDSLAIARRDGMSEEVFRQKVQRIRGELAKLDPYGDGKDLLKLEDANFDPADAKTIVELQCLAISAKRYVLFYLGEDGKPVICKASAHGLGHLRPPYEEKDAPAHLPAPKIPLKDIGVDRWQHDLWTRIIEAELAGRPNQVDLTGLPNMDEPAISRYSASTPDLLRWFGKFNEGKDWDEQVKPFNFLVAFQISPTARAKAIADGTFDQEWLKGDGPSPIAPFDKDVKKAANKCIDRVTGKPVPKSLLATYREVLSDYHLHAEAKFLNGEPFDRGRTQRQPVRATAVELIGKEANRWEEQFCLGEDQDAQISYGLIPSFDAFHQRLGGFIRTSGLSRVSEAAGVSRPPLTKLFKTQATPTKRMRERLEEAFTVLEGIEAREQAHKDKTLVRLKKRAAEVGQKQLAAELGMDRGNLSAILAGRRRPPVKSVTGTS